MRALTLVADRQLVVADAAPPPPPDAGEVQIRVNAVALNHIDVWGYRGMAFAKRKLPLVVGAEASPAAPAAPVRMAATISAKMSPASWAFMSTASPASC